MRGSTHQPAGMIQVPRQLGVTEALQHLPETVVALFGLITQLGSVWFVAVLFVGVYVFGPERWFVFGRRRSVLHMVGLATIAAIGTHGLKTALAQPRPPSADVVPIPYWLPDAIEPLYTLLLTSGGYGFPSGHAIMSVVVYGALAMYTTVGTFRQRVLAAGGMSILIGLSRLVLGVHYLGDVLVGFAIGSAFVIGAYYLLADRRPSSLFGTRPTR